MRGGRLASVFARPTSLTTAYPTAPPSSIRLLLLLVHFCSFYSPSPSSHLHPQPLPRMECYEADNMRASSSHSRSDSDVLHTSDRAGINEVHLYVVRAVCAHHFFVGAVGRRVSRQTRLLPPSSLRHPPSNARPRCHHLHHHHATATPTSRPCWKRGPPSPYAVYKVEAIKAHHHFSPGVVFCGILASIEKQCTFINEWEDLGPMQGTPKVADVVCSCQDHHATTHPRHALLPDTRMRTTSEDRCHRRLRRGDGV